MTGKITTAVVAAILLGSAGVASAQVGRTGLDRPTHTTAPITVETIGAAFGRNAV